MKVILLTEYYDYEFPKSMLLNYNLLPSNNKKLIDTALVIGGSVAVNVYEDGLQSLDFKADYNIINTLPIIITEIVPISFYSI